MALALALDKTATGPLAGVQVVELGGKGSVGFAAMLLADLGADVKRILRPTDSRAQAAADGINRGKSGVHLDLATDEGRRSALALIARADIVIEGFRTGVADALGVGSDACLAVNPRVVYGTVTGWGRGGPLAYSPGHDINFIALSGALHPIGEAGGPPVVPSNFVGAAGGGAMSLAFGVVAALWESRRSGQGQVVDASIVDGSSMLTTGIRNFVNAGEWSDDRGSNLLDGGAPFYGVYETLDQEYVSIGALEPQFYRLLLSLLEIPEGSFPEQLDREKWAFARSVLADRFRTKTRDEWCQLLEGTDVCFAPVLSLAEAPLHRHNTARQAFLRVDDAWQPAPSPRFSRTAPGAPRPMD
ncbi:CaiB/BaiF CoA-transferase family protein [soil metagenome]